MKKISIDQEPTSEKKRKPDNHLRNTDGLGGKKRGLFSRLLGLHCAKKKKEKTKHSFTGYVTFFVYFC